MARAVSEEFVYQREGEELIARLEAVEVNPAEFPFAPLAKEERAAVQGGDTTIDLRHLGGRPPARRVG